MKQQLENIKTVALEAIDSAQNLKELENIRVRFLGKKGELTTILKQMGKLSAEERPVMGQLANSVREAMESELGARTEYLQKKQLEERLESEKLDVTIPGRRFEIGRRHPMSIVLDEAKDIFIGLGF